MRTQSHSGGVQYSLKDIDGHSIAFRGCSHSLKGVHMHAIAFRGCSILTQRHSFSWSHHGESRSIITQLGGARQVLISREITLRHKELKIARLTLSCNRGKSLYFFKTSVLHHSNCQNRNWTNRHFSPICFIDIETLRRDNVESLNTAALGQH